MDISSGLGFLCASVSESFCDSVSGTTVGMTVTAVGSLVVIACVAKRCFAQQREEPAQNQAAAPRAMKIDSDVFLNPQPALDPRTILDDEVVLNPGTILDDEVVLNPGTILDDEVALEENDESSYEKLREILEKKHSFMDVFDLVKKDPNCINFLNRFDVNLLRRVIGRSFFESIGLSFSNEFLKNLVANIDSCDLFGDEFERYSPFWCICSLPDSYFNKNIFSPHFSDNFKFFLKERYGEDFISALINSHDFQFYLEDNIDVFKLLINENNHFTQDHLDLMLRKGRCRNKSGRN